MTLTAGLLFIQISVIYDVIIKPSSPQYVNLFVIVFAIASILFSWVVDILQLPLPEVDISNYDRLSEIKENDPEKYKEIIKNSVKENSKKETFSRIFISVLVYIVTYTGVAIYWFPGVLERLVDFLGNAMAGAFLVMFFSNEVVGFFNKRIWIWFFRSYPSETDERTSKFIKLKKVFLFLKIIVPLVMSTVYVFYTLSHCCPVNFHSNVN